MRTLHGTPASPGVARGPVVVIRPAPRVEGGRIDSAGAEAEIERLAAALEASALALEAEATALAATIPDEAAIFEAHALFARDEALLESAGERIRGGEDAIAAVRAAMAEFADALRDSDDELFAARAADLDDVAERIVVTLAGTGPAVPQLAAPSIVVARDLPPSITARIRDRLVGIALEEGSKTAHAAILARALGIPAVVGVAGLLEVVGDGGPDALLDGTTGEVVLDPDGRALARFAAASEAARGAEATAHAEATQAAVTRSGIEVTLLANVGGPDEAPRAMALGAHGVGLFRTEFLFVEKSAPPSEDAQVAAYRAVVDAFAPYPVTIRLLDVGGDKPIPYVRIAPEDNPFLGVRSLRLAWDRPDLFVTQLRAALRAATGTPPGTVLVMAPMVADARDVDLLLDLVVRARTTLASEGVPFGEIDLGVMLEIPSAVLLADTYLPRLSFASLGTNDLLQYTLAVDRGNAGLERYRDFLHPAVLRLVREAVEASERARTELSVCGEMAGDPTSALALVAIGVRKLSMAASSLAPVRRAIRGADAAFLEEARRLALESATAAEVAAGMAVLLARTGPG